MSSETDSAPKELDGPNTTAVESGKPKRARTPAQREAFEKARAARAKQLEELRSLPKTERPKSLRKTAALLANELAELKQQLSAKSVEQQPAAMPDRPKAGAKVHPVPSAAEEDIEYEADESTIPQGRPRGGTFGRNVYSQGRNHGSVPPQMMQPQQPDYEYEEGEVDAMQDEEQEEYEEPTQRPQAPPPQQRRPPPPQAPRASAIKVPLRGPVMQPRNVPAPRAPAPIQKRKAVADHYEESYEEQEFADDDDEMDQSEGNMSALRRATPQQRLQYHQNQNRTNGRAKQPYTETQSRVQQFSKWLALG